MHKVVRLAPLSAALCLCACAPSLIPGTNITDKPDTRAALDVLSKYKIASEALDSDAVLELAASTYFDNGSGRPAPPPGQRLGGPDPPAGRLRELEDGGGRRVREAARAAHGHHHQGRARPGRQSGDRLLPGAALFAQAALRREVAQRERRRAPHPRQDGRQVEGHLGHVADGGGGSVEAASAVLARVRFVLCRPRNPQNVGAAARALCSAGVRDLVLVDPQCDPRDPEAFRLAVHAGALLESARVAPTLAAALEGAALSAGATARFPPP